MKQYLNTNSYILKPRIFIGSSSESKKVALLVKKYLGSKYDCIVWTDNFFELNKNTYHNLIKQSIGFDYSIFIGGEDDITIRIKDTNIKVSPRDNIYLEFGLYAGVLSPDRSYFILHKSCSVATDLSGITILNYTDDYEIQLCCEKIEQKIKDEEKINRISLLPSTSLAIGYFENFLKKISQALFNLKNIEVDGHNYDVSKISKKLQVIIPDNIDEDWYTWAEVFYKNCDVRKVNINTSMRTLGVILDYHKFINERKVQILDIPQTIRAAFQSIELVIGRDYIGNTSLFERAKKREVDNFIKTLINLIKTDSYANDIVIINICSKETFSSFV